MHKCAILVNKAYGQTSYCAVSFTEVNDEGPAMRLNTVKKAGTFWPDGSSTTGPLDLRHGRSLQTMLRALAEIDRIRGLQKPSHKSHARAQLLQEMIVTALGVDSFATAEKVLTEAQRQRVASSIEAMLNRAATREKKAATKRVRAEAQEARRQVRERKDDTRRKIIIGGTIIAAIRGGVPGKAALLESIKSRLSTPNWQFAEPIFTPSDDDHFLAWARTITHLDPAKLAAQYSDRGQLVSLYQDTEVQLERALDLAQAWNDPEQRRQRGADARRKIMVGGAILAAIREEDATASMLLQLLDERIVSVRDREAVRVVLPLAEFRPRPRV